MSNIIIEPASQYDIIRFIIEAFDPLAGEDLTQRQPYELLDYIVGTQNAFIDLGLVATGATRVNCEFIWTSQYSYNFLFGSGTAYNSASFEFYNNSSATTFASNYNGSYSPSGNFTAGQRLELDKNRGVTTIKDVATDTVIGSQDLAESSFTSGSNMQIFRINRDNYYTSWPQILYYFHMWDNDNPRRFLLPVRRVSDGAVGLLDVSIIAIALSDPIYATSIGLDPSHPDHYVGAGKFYGNTNTTGLISAGPRTTQYSLTSKTQSLLQNMRSRVIETDTRTPLKYVTTGITKRKYYKSVAYIQPVFGANTYEYDTVIKGRDLKHIKFELTASHQSGPAWYAFNRSLTGDNCWWTAHGVTSESNPCWLTFQSNNKMLFNRVWLMNENTSPANFNHCTLQASNDNLNWTNLIEFYGTDVASYVTSVDIPKEKQAPYYYYRLYFDSAYSTGGVSLQLITFEGSMLIESNEEDYDYYEEYTAFDVEPDSNKLFYKYNGVNQPVPATINDYDFYIKKGLTFTAQAN